MGNESKTRFFACIGKVDRVLFSVMQTSDKGLTITSRTPKFWENPNGTLEEFQQQHYSVHPTNGNADTTITQKTQLRDSSHHSNVTFIPGTQDHLLWPIYARRFPIFEGDLGIVKRRPKETFIKVAEFDYDEASLLYSVFVCRPTYDTRVLKENNVTFQSVTFENFAVIVIPTFMNIPSVEPGDVIGMSSSTPVVNYEKTSEHKQFNVRSIPPESIVMRHWFLMGLLRERFVQRLHMLYRGEQVQVAQILFHFTQQPGIQNLLTMGGLFDEEEST